MLLSCKVKTLWHAFLTLLTLFFYCEFLHYYIILIQCRWPNSVVSSLPYSFIENKLKVMVIADTHLLGSRQGHWFDKLRREWQMERSFQTTLSIHRPDAVFILGDLFDEGLWCSDEEFRNYVRRFNKIFRHPNSTQVHVAVGNHDIGFHYMISPEHDQRFTKLLSAPSVQVRRINGNLFVLINSMALEGDGCKLCREAEVTLSHISDELLCAERASRGDVLATSCDEFYIPYVEPIIMQHFPMYRSSDVNCSTLDSDPTPKKHHLNRQKFDVLSKEASEKLIKWLQPRLIVGAHTHHGCYRTHPDGTPEWTVASFSWRNKKNPTFLLMTVSPENFQVAQCFLPDERTVILLYAIGAVCVLVFFIVIPRKYIQKINVTHQ